jgi:hypothetical protein
MAKVQDVPFQAQDAIFNGSIELVIDYKYIVMLCGWCRASTWLLGHALLV